MYCGRGASARDAAAGGEPDPVEGPVAGGFRGAWAEADMATSWLTQKAERERGALLLGYGHLDGFAGRDDLACEAVELGSDLRVVRQGQRHAGVERGGYGLVVARECVVNAVAE